MNMFFKQAIHTVNYTSMNLSTLKTKKQKVLNDNI
jgi:hypothetical protein